MLPDAVKLILQFLGLFLPHDFALSGGLADLFVKWFHTTNPIFQAVRKRWGIRSGALRWAAPTLPLAAAIATTGAATRCHFRLFPGRKFPE